MRIQEFGLYEMTQTEKTTFESQTTLEKMNGHATDGTESQSSVDSSPSSVSPPESSPESILAMGSTDSAGSNSSCGLVSSLFPSSCRGRAEAFARRLHRRLTSLGNETSEQPESDLAKVTPETTWIPGTTTQVPTENHYHDEPLDKDASLYFEFSLDLEDNGPGSPAEAATPAEISDLLVNSQPAKRKNQDDATTPETDESEMYFDPVSSDSEKKSETYFDPVVTSDSESSARMTTNGAVNGYGSHDRRENGEAVEFSRSSSSDTTSPSHESLWSTFDESTLSQDDQVTGNRLGDSTPESSGVDEVDFVREFPQETEPSNGTHQESCPGDDVDTDTDNSTYSSSINIPGALECPLKPEGTSGDLMRNEVEIRVEDGVMMNGASEDKITRLLEKLGHNCTGRTSEIEQDETNEEEHRSDSKGEEEEEQRPPRVRRCSSLKTGKTPPGTPGRKKIVRFADVLGLDLADVRTFLDEIPRVPNSAYSDLIYDDVFHKDNSPGVQSWSARYMDNRLSSCPGQKADRSLVPLFQQPGSLPSFLDIVRERLVCLDNAVVQDPVNLAIHGTVRVLNLDFHKSVHIRYTTNCWRSFKELQAAYVPNSCDGFSDKFTFLIYCSQLQVGQRLEFAVRFHCKGMQHWDNNCGANYCFQCLPARSPSGYIPIVPTESAHDWVPMFY